MGSDGVRATGSDRNQLIAHEVVHTLQQGQVGPLATMRVGDADDRHERQAERISHAFAHGGVAEEVNHVGAPVIQRTPVTGHYGKFEDFYYQNLTNTTGVPVGVAMYLKFHPNSNVIADPIGFTQTAIGTRNGVTDTAGIRGLHQATSGAGVGRFIDRMPGQPNPIYGTGPTASAGGTPNDLTAYPAKPITPLTTPQQQQAVAATFGNLSGIQYTGGTKLGYRFLFLGGKYAESAAEMSDVLALGTAPMPNSGQVFETAALALDGPQKGTYYGSVEWGWRTDAAGAFTRIPLRLISDGVPSANFLTAASIWNASRVDLGYETTVATSILHPTTFAPITQIVAGTQLKATGNEATVNNVKHYEVTFGANPVLVDSTKVRAVAVGVQTVDLPVPIVYTVSNAQGTALLPSATPAPGSSTVTLPAGTRITITRLIPTAGTMPNLMEGNVAAGPQTGTHGFFVANDLAREQLGTR